MFWKLLLNVLVQLSIVKIKRTKTDKDVVLRPCILLFQWDNWEISPECVSICLVMLKDRPVANSLEMDRRKIANDYHKRGVKYV